jgi:hypothetical protein
MSGRPAPSQECEPRLSADGLRNTLPWDRMHRDAPFDLRGRSVLVACGNRGLGLGLGLAGVLGALGISGRVMVVDGGARAAVV